MQRIRNHGSAKGLSLHVTSAVLKRDVAFFETFDHKSYGFAQLQWIAVNSNHSDLSAALALQDGYDWSVIQAVLDGKWEHPSLTPVFCGSYLSGRVYGASFEPKKIIALALATIEEQVLRPARFLVQLQHVDISPFNMWNILNRLPDVSYYPHGSGMIQVSVKSKKFDVWVKDTERVWRDLSQIFDYCYVNKILGYPNKFPFDQTAYDVTRMIFALCSISFRDGCYRFHLGDTHNFPSSDSLGVGEEFAMPARTAIREFLSINPSVPACTMEQLWTHTYFLIHTRFNWQQGPGLRMHKVAEVCRAQLTRLESLSLVKNSQPINEKIAQKDVLDDSTFTNLAYMKTYYQSMTEARFASSCFLSTCVDVPGPLVRDVEATDALLHHLQISKRCLVTGRDTPYTVYRKVFYQGDNRSTYWNLLKTLRMNLDGYDCLRFKGEEGGEITQFYYTSDGTLEAPNGQRTEFALEGQLCRKNDKGAIFAFIHTFGGSRLYKTATPMSVKYESLVDDLVKNSFWGSIVVRFNNIPLSCFRSIKKLLYEKYAGYFDVTLYKSAYHLDSDIYIGLHRGVYRVATLLHEVSKEEFLPTIVSWRLSTNKNLRLLRTQLCLGLTCLPKGSGGLIDYAVRFVLASHMGWDFYNRTEYYSFIQRPNMNFLDQFVQPSDTTPIGQPTEGKESGAVS